VATCLRGPHDAFDAEAANLFLQLVSSRYERGSVIVTSNKPFTAWPKVRHLRGRDLRRSGRRSGHDRPTGPPRDPFVEGRLLPAKRQETHRFQAEGGYDTGC
jgi:hypothetical protein